MKKPHILIIGAGRIGGALKQLLEGSATISQFDEATGKVPDQKPLEQTAPKADMIFLCIPSWVTRNALTNIKPHIRKDAVIVSLAKGIERESKMIINKVITDVLGEQHPQALLYGPMLAEEFNNGLRGYGIVATTQAEIFTAIDALFLKTPLIIEHSTDVQGVAISGVLKNIYALALGIAAGLEWGSNTAGWLTSHALQEMTRVAEKLGSKYASVEGIAGLGDLVASGFSPYSKNRATGHNFVAAGEQAIGSEGAVSLPSLLELLGDSAEDFLLLQFLKRIIIDQEQTELVLNQFIEQYRKVAKK